jgi:hypothetical protein
MERRGTLLMLSAEQWESTKLLLQKICADDIYSALFYHAMPDNFLNYKHTTLFGSKKAVDCITVLCCSNISGTDKQKLFVSGKRANPLCFMGISMDSLPVLYYANKDAGMISEIFNK